VLRQLHYLLALAREKHFGRAAASIPVSQPTLSAAIRDLEQELGVPVVERGQRFRGLTPEGEVVLGYAKQITSLLGEMRQSLDEMRGGLRGRLRFGAIPTALPVISAITAPFYARHPHVTIAILSLTSDQIQSGINNFEIDVGLTYLDNEPLDHVRARPIYSEEYVLLTAEEDVYAGRESITWREAAQLPLCLLTPDMQNRRIIDGIFRSVGEAPVPGVETNSIFNLYSHAATGFWSSIIPVPLLRFFGVPARGRALKLVEPEAKRSVGLVIADREPAAPLARALFTIAPAVDVSSRLTGPLAEV
jgi:DNA-binding transcriptional LysR family regulator